MPTLAIAFEFPTLAGGERSMLSVLGEAPPAGWDVVAVAPGEGPLAEASSSIGIPVVPFDLRAEGNKPPPEFAATMLGDVIDRVSPTAVHANSLSMSRVTGRLAATRADADAPLNTTGHLRDIMKLSKAAIADLNSNRALLCVSHATRQAHVAQGLNPSIAHVVHNGVRAEPRTREAGWLHQELQVDGGLPLIATVGQICLRKGHDIAAAALSQIEDRDWRWLIIGDRFSQKAESIEFDRNIESILHSNGLGDRIIRLGFRHDMADIYPELSLLLHAARQEPFGRVLLEAGAYNLPVVATDAGGTREIVGPAMPLCTIDDVEAMSQLVRSALDTPNDRTFDVSSLTVEASATACWDQWKSTNEKTSSPRSNS